MPPVLQRSRQLLWVLLFTCAPVLLLYAATRVGSESLPGEGPAAGLVGAAQELRDQVTGGLAHLWGDYVGLVDARRDQDRLRAENGRLRFENRRLAAIAHENARLRSLLGFRDRQQRKHELLPARVIAKDTSPFFRVIKIALDAGEHGPRLRVGQPVVSTRGVVGQVSRVHDGFADVLLVADGRSAVDVVIQRNRARGILKGLGASDEYDCRIEYLLRTDEVARGDVVVTSGMDGRYPKDLKVGTVSQVSRREYGLYQQVKVEPAVDFSRLEEALIIVEAEDPEDDADPSEDPGSAPRPAGERTAPASPAP
jgi:rod shape-determining protein MreC